MCARRGAAACSYSTTCHTIRLFSLSHFSYFAFIHDCSNEVGYKDTERETEVNNNKNFLFFLPFAAKATRARFASFSLLMFFFVRFAWRKMNFSCSFSVYAAFFFFFAWITHLFQWHAVIHSHPEMALSYCEILYICAVCGPVWASVAADIPAVQAAAPTAGSFMFSSNEFIWILAVLTFLKENCTVLFLRPTGAGWRGDGASEMIYIYVLYTFHAIMHAKRKLCMLFDLCGFKSNKVNYILTMEKWTWIPSKLCIMGKKLAGKLNFSEGEWMLHFLYFHNQIYGQRDKLMTR